MKKPTCKTCPYCHHDITITMMKGDRCFSEGGLEIPESAINGQCRRRPPQPDFQKVHLDNWCGEHPGIKASIDSIDRLTEAIDKLRLALWDEEK